MEMDSELPEEIVELFKEQVPSNVSVYTGEMDRNSLVLRNDADDTATGVEFIRQLGVQCVEEVGYAITGIRHHDVRGEMELWFDSLDDTDSTQERTLGTATLHPSESIDLLDHLTDAYSVEIDTILGDGQIVVVIIDR